MLVDHPTDSTVKPDTPGVRMELVSVDRTDKSTKLFATMGC